MEITVASAVVHELVKDREMLADPVAQNKRNELLPIDNQVTALLKKIHEVHGTRENVCEYGIFNQRQEPFPTVVHSYLEDNSEDFLGLSHVFFDELLCFTNKERFATGGYIVCADYSANGLRFITVVMIKKTAEMRFTRDLRPQEVEALNLRKLHQAVRVNTDRYLNQPTECAALQEHNYLSFLGESTTGAANYFTLAAGCEKGISSQNATIAVYRYLDSKFDKNEKLINLKNDANNGITALLRDKIDRGISVRLSEIVDYLRGNFSTAFDDPGESNRFFDQLIDEMNGEEFRIPNEFNPHQRTVQNRTRISYKNNDFQINLEAGAIDTNNTASPVYWDSRDGILTIRADDRLKKEIEDKLTGE